MKKKKNQMREDLVIEVQEDFLARQKERRVFESQWQLNNNFLIGNQYSSINSVNEVEEYDKQFFWQEREVFNHIAPIIEARLSKLSSVQPKMNISPVSSEEGDLKVAKLSKDIIKGVYDKLNLKSIIAQATQWSEITGTSFYKIVWNMNSGKAVYVNENKQKVYEGEVEIAVVPPYEIFPESSSCGSLEECFSIIHAKAYHIKDIKNIWGIEVEGGEVDIMSLSHINNMGGLGYRAGSNKVVNNVKHNHAIVIERYEAPSVEYPNGRLVIVCQDKLLYVGDLPYINSYNNKRGFPFVRQISIEQPGCFWGTSVIERIIPIQRAYNAVKNRKHEYLNRLSMGVLTVEDGSLDTENLEEEGLSPGKVLIYRQGSTPPKMMQTESLPGDFDNEEKKLLDEFCEISGVNSVLTSQLWSKNMSGAALEILTQQDTARMFATINNIKNAVLVLTKHILKLYKQFAVTPRLLKINNSNGDCEVVYWKNSDLGCDEIQFLSESEDGESLQAKREQILKLLEAGLLYDASGKPSNSLRVKVLELFGLGVWDGNTDESVLQKNYADSENIKLINDCNEVEVLEIDNHEIHLSSHISFMLDKQFASAKRTQPNIKERFLNHIKEHKKAMQNIF